MDKYIVLKDWKGSPDGRFVVNYKEGEVVELTEALAIVALKEKWVGEYVEETDDITALLSLSVGKITENFPAIDDEELQQLLIAEEKADEPRVTLIKAIKEEQSSRDKS